MARIICTQFVSTFVQDFQKLIKTVLHVPKLQIVGRQWKKEPPSMCHIN